MLTSKERLEDLGRKIAAGDRPDAEAIDEVVIGAEDLDEAAFEVVDALRDLEDPERVYARVGPILERRDRIELRCIAAEALGRSMEIEDEASLVAFEEALRPHVWRLTALNEHRGRKVRWVRDDLRERFWWWSEAAEIDPRGATHLGAVADLVARFPEAEASLRKIATTTLLMQDAGEARVVSLADWIAMRTHREGIALAASEDREHVVLEHDKFTVSWLEPNILFVDLAESSKAPPQLVAGTTVLEGLPVEDAVERFHFTVTEDVARHAGRIVVTVSSGKFEVPLG